MVIQSPFSCLLLVAAVVDAPSTTDAVLDRGLREDHLGGAMDGVKALPQWAVKKRLLSSISIGIGGVIFLAMVVIIFVVQYVLLWLFGPLLLLSVCARAVSTYLL